jgi:catechol 2,3-dioxygenase-like lactoylglutathione lyase family enzyme
MSILSASFDYLPYRGTSSLTSSIQEKPMLGNKDALTMIAVKNLGVAKAFYEGTLELKQADGGNAEVLQYRTGNSQISVYKSQYAGTNKATTLTWPVGDDFDRIVQALKAKNVKFEHYDLPDTTRDGDVHVTGSFKVAWFKDPDGNILSIVNQ